MWKQLAEAYKDMQTEKASQGMFVVVQGSKYKVLGQFKDKKKAMDLMKKNPKSKTIQIGKFATVDDKPIDIKVGDELSYTRFKMSTKIKEEVNPNCDCVDCNCDPCECGDWREGMGPEGGGHKTSDAEGLGEETLMELSAEEKKLIDKMYDKKGNLTPIGKAVMDAGKMRGKSPSQMGVLTKKK